MAKTQTKRAADRIAQYGTSSDAVVVYIADHEHFSNYADRHFVTPALKSARPDNKTPAIVSVCAYTPSFFYRRIKQKSADDAQKQLLTQFESVPAAELLAGNADAQFTSVREAFLQAAHTAFPHFGTVERDAQKAVRLCVFCRDDASDVGKQLRSTAILGDDDYLARYGLTIPAAHTYSFFKWLNNDVPCHILPPTQWSVWGLGQGRDFALFNSRDVVEYHDQWNSAIIVENVDDNWNEFARISSLVSRWKASAKATWEPWIFFARSYGLVMPDTIAGLIEKAARHEGDDEDPDRANIRREILASLPKLRTGLLKLEPSDVSAIMGRSEQVAQLLHGNLDISSNATGFRDAVALLLAEVGLQAGGAKRTQA